MEHAQVVRFLSRTAVALLLPAGGVVTALLSSPIEEEAFRRACGRVCATQPMPVEVTLGEYEVGTNAFTECSLRMPDSDTRTAQGLTKFRRLKVY
jgi:hypothetical protein